MKIITLTWIVIVAISFFTYASEGADCQFPSPDLLPNCMIALNDDDGDGIPNGEDNCTQTAPLPGGVNGLDTDGDGYGNLCDGDLNQDGVVNFVDVILFADQFLATGPNDADFNGDEIVNFLDNGILMSLFLQPLGPSYVDCLDTVSVADYGLVANDPFAASTNTAMFRAMVSPIGSSAWGYDYGGVNTITKTIIFPNGTYYFDDVIPFRQDLATHIDLRGSTLHFSKEAVTNDQGTGFLHTLHDLILENGSIEVDYAYADCESFDVPMLDEPGCLANDGCYLRSEGTPPVLRCRAPLHAGAAIMLGTRNSVSTFPLSPVNQTPNPVYFPGGYDGELVTNVSGVDVSYQMGDIKLKNLQISSNNEHDIAARSIFMLGGLKNVCFEGVSIDGQGVIDQAISYEFGFGAVAMSPMPEESSHAHDMEFRNTTITNLNPSTSESVGIRLGGAYDVLVDGLDVDGAAIGAQMDAGEAAYYHTWNDGMPVPLAADRIITLKNVKMRNIRSVGLVLDGAGSFATGYLNNFVPNPMPEDQTDLIYFDVENIDLAGDPQANATGMVCGGGGLILRDFDAEVDFKDFFAAIRIGADLCTEVEIDGITVHDSGSTGIHIGWNHAGAFYTPIRKITGHIKGSTIAGSGQNAPNHAITVSEACDFTIENNIFGIENGTGTQQNAAVAIAHDMPPSVKNLFATGNTVWETNNTQAYWTLIPDNQDNELNLNLVSVGNFGITSVRGPWVTQDNGVVSCN